LRRDIRLGAIRHTAFTLAQRPFSGVTEAAIEGAAFAPFTRQRVPRKYRKGQTQREHDNEK